MERESPAERERIATSISNAEYHVVPTQEEEEEAAAAAVARRGRMKNSRVLATGRGGGA